jgi:hypothetical protein
VRYTIRRITLPSALRIGLAVGWLVALPPSCLLAALLVPLLQRVYATLAGIKPIELSVFGQEILRLDVLESLQMQETLATLQWVDANSTTTLLLLTLVLVVLGSVLLVVVLLLFCLAYNLIARLGAGLDVELEGRMR